MIDQTAADDQPSAQHPAPSAQQVDAGSDTAALNPAAGSVLPEGGAPDDGAVAKAEVLQDLPVAGTGIDIVEIARMERAITRTPRILWRLFSAQEQAYCNSKARPATHYALFFAAKEAVLKALGTGFVGMAFHDVEVAHDRFGRPVPVLHGHAQEVAAALGVVELQLSLSYTHQVGVASAVAIKQENRPHKDESLDPHAELARQFKELRALLDNMDERLASLDDADANGDEPSASLADADANGDEYPLELADADANGDERPLELADADANGDERPASLAEPEESHTEP